MRWFTLLNPLMHLSLWSHKTVMTGDSTNILVMWQVDCHSTPRKLNSYHALSLDKCAPKLQMILLLFYFISRNCVPLLGYSCKSFQDK
jgi:hypothetical protein